MSKSIRIFSMARANQSQQKYFSVNVVANPRVQRQQWKALAFHPRNVAVKVEPLTEIALQVSTIFIWLEVVATRLYLVALEYSKAKLFFVWILLTTQIEGFYNYDT